MSVRCLFVGAFALLLTACSSVAPPRFDAANPAQRACIDWFDRLDAVVAAAGVADAQEARIPAFPHLRANRFVAALAQDARIDNAAFERDVLPLLRTLDRDARAAEISNLPPGALAQLGSTRAEVVQRSAACGSTLTAATHLPRAAAAVPDDYSDAQRLLGAYALTRLAFSAGVQRHLADVHAAFARPLETSVRVQRYAVAEAPADGGALGTQTTALLEQHQPVFEVEVDTDADRPGALVWDASRGTPVVQTRRPTVYRHVAFTRYRGQTLTQLVYTLWFGARPAEGAGDLLAGHLDGLIWRVTLDAQGRALVYDTMHPCGCYHHFIPTPRATPLPAPAGEPEWAFVPQTLAEPESHERVVLRIAARTHYLERATLEAASTAGRHALPLAVLAQDRLRTLPVVAGVADVPGAGQVDATAPGHAPPDAAPTRSAYGPDGLVPGSERAERFLFWPMGIASAGQMRQWGRHATAFVGRRHFDDADLFEKRFVLALEGR